MNLVSITYILFLFVKEFSTLIPTMKIVIAVTTGRLFPWQALVFCSKCSIEFHCLRLKKAAVNRFAAHDPIRYNNSIYRVHDDFRVTPPFSLSHLLFDNSEMLQIVIKNLS